MTVEFRCENCGKLLDIEASPGAQVRCPHCKGKVTVPAALAALPQPQVPDPSAPPPVAPTVAVAAPPLPPPSLPPTEGEDEEGEEGEGDSDGEAVMNAMAHVMPWVISLFLHIGIIVLLGFGAMFIRKSKAEEPVVADTSLADDAGGVEDPGKDDPELRAEQDKVQTTSDQFADVDSNMQSTSPVNSTNDPLFGMSSSAAGGQLAAFGLNTGGANQGPRNEFYGTGGNAHHVVYVVDRSGSMHETFDFVRDELLRDISDMSPSQDFHVIFFAEGRQQGQLAENKPRRLVKASDRNKDEVAEFVKNVIVSGSVTNPIPALKRAFSVLSGADRKLKGKLIYLLTDGEFVDNRAVVEELRKLNKGKGVVIHTILHEHQDAEAEKILRLIAKENSGKFKFVQEVDY